LSVSTPVAHALPAMLETRHSVQPQILERVRSNLAWLDTELSREVPVTRLRVEGGWYAVLRLPAIESDEDWAVKLLAEDGVFIHPGHFYDFGAEGHLVVSLLPTTEIFREGIAKVLARVRCAG
jgi:alanine-synthesizing transaminase